MITQFAVPLLCPMMLENVENEPNPVKRNTKQKKLEIHCSNNLPVGYETSFDDDDIWLTSRFTSYGSNNSDHTSTFRKEYIYICT